MSGTEVRTTQVVYDKAGKLDVVCGELLLLLLGVYGFLWGREGWAAGSNISQQQACLFRGFAAA